MALTALQLQAKVSADISDAVTGLKNVKQEADNASGDSGGGGIKGFITHVAEMVTASAIFHGVAGAVSFLADQVKDSINAAQQYQYVQAQTNAVLKSTGDASGQTAQSIADLAEHLSTLTPFSRDATQSAENMLLTFTNIKGNLPAVTQTTLDFATAMHMDATSAALQLGKALNDPATGYSKLQREGVTFSASQIASIKAMEKSGNMAGAQAIILKELQKEFGGSATAAGSTFAGGLQILQNQLEDTKEKIGAALIPVLSQLLTALAPLMAAFADFVGKALGGLASFLTGDVIPAMQQWMPVIGAILNAAKLLGNVFMSALKPALDQIGQAFSKANGPGISAKQVIGQIGQVVQQLVPFFQQAGKVVGQLALTFATNILPALQNFGGFVQTSVLPILAQFGGFILTTVVPALANLGSFIATNVIPVVEQIVTWFGQKVMPILTQVASIVIQNVVPALKEMWNTVATQLIPALENLWNKISPVLIPIFQFLAGPVLNGLVVPAFKFTWNVISLVITILGDLIGAIGWVLGKLGNLKDFLGGELSNAWTGLGNLVKGIWSGISDAVKGGINGVISIINGLISAIDNIHINIPSVGPFGGGSIGFSIPQIPYLAEGGDVTRGGEAVVGDKGPERISLPTGARVTPLPAGLNAAGGGQAQTVQVQTTINLDGYKLAQVVTKHTPKAVRNATGRRDV